MGPKKKGKKKGGDDEEDGTGTGYPAPETNKAFYELQIKDLNNKLARLRGSYNELENKLTDTQEEFKKLDEDRADIIAFLERTLASKTDEIGKLTAKIIQMEEEREAVIQVYKDQVIQIEREYKIMRQDLSSKIKLLMGKLNSLEEFRSQRNDLMEKYENQEKRIEEQEERHKKTLYEAERKFIIGKDTLKKEMESRLLQLSADFQKATEMRIAATTHRVIRENIALNNEFDSIFSTLQRLEDENDKLKSDDKILKLSVNLLDDEKKKILEKSYAQDHLLIRLSQEHDNMVQKLYKFKDLDKKFNTKSEELYNANKKMNAMLMEIKKLEQFVHQVKCDKLNVETELGNQKLENERLTAIIYSATSTIQKIMEYRTITNSRKKFRSIVKILDRAEEESPDRIISLATVSSHDLLLPREKDTSYILLPKLKPHVYVRNVTDEVTRVTSSLAKMEPFVRHEIEEEVTEEISEEEKEEVEEEITDESSSENLLMDGAIKTPTASLASVVAEDEEYHLTNFIEYFELEGGEYKTPSIKSVSTVIDTNKE